jgi:hypothetical protein
MVVTSTWVRIPCWVATSTAAKYGRDHLDVLVELFTTGPWLPPDPAPI